LPAHALKNAILHGDSAFSCACTLCPNVRHPQCVPSCLCGAHDHVGDHACSSSMLAGTSATAPNGARHVYPAEDAKSMHSHVKRRSQLLSEHTWDDAAAATAAVHTCDSHDGRLNRMAECWHRSPPNPGTATWVLLLVTCCSSAAVQLMGGFPPPHCEFLTLSSSSVLQGQTISRCRA
jgi:hypothetical protein